MTINDKDRIKELKTLIRSAENSLDNNSFEGPFVMRKIKIEEKRKWEKELELIEKDSQFETITKEQAMDIIKEGTKGAFLDVYYRGLNGFKYCSLYINSQGKLIVFQADDRQLKLIEEGNYSKFLMSIGIKLDSDYAREESFNFALDIFEHNDNNEFEIYYKLIDLY